MEIPKGHAKHGHTVKEIKKLEKIIEKLKRVELEQFTNYLHSPWRILWANFLAGTSRGLGFLIGATLIITIVGFIVSRVLTQIPFVGDFFEAANHWIEETIRDAQGR